MIQFLLLILAAYLAGSIPFGVLIARAHGKDLRAIGSGNIGATNVARALGKKWAYLCFALDCMKGLAPMLIAGRLVSASPTIAALSLWLAVGLAAVAGHIFPVYLRFKGGKGVATALGIVLGLYPYYTIPGLVTFAIWIIVVLLSKYVSLASIVAAVAFPISLVIAISLSGGWTFASLWPLIIVAILIAAMIIIRHAENIKRLLDGSEGKVLQG